MQTEEYRDLFVELTPEELAEREREAGRNACELVKLLAEKKSAMEAFGWQEKRLKVAREELAEVIRDKREQRRVLCRWIEIGTLRQLIRSDTDEKLEERQLRTDEMRERRQTKLPLEDGPSHASNQGDDDADEAQAEDDDEPGDDEDEPASNGVEKQEDPAGEAEIPQLMPALADRMLGVVRQLSDGQLRAGSSEYVRLSELRTLFPEETLPALREAGEVLLERGAIEQLPSNPGVWKPVNEVNAQIELEEAEQEALNELAVCQALGALHGESTAHDVLSVIETPDDGIEFTFGDVESVLARLIERGCVRIVSEGPKKGRVYGLLAASERVLCQLRDASPLSASALARLAVLSEADLAEACSKLILRGLVAEGPRGYALRDAKPANDAPAKKRGGKKQAARAAE